MPKPPTSARTKPEVEPERVFGRGFWSGTLTFGLVSIAVELLPANRSPALSLRTLGPSGLPLSRRYYEPSSGEEVSSQETQRGFEVEPGRFVVITDEELESLAPEKSRDITLELFVAADTLDPLYFERSYFLAPARGSGRPYRLLAAVIEKTNQAGIATFVMRGREHLVAILAENGILRAETLRFATELRTPEAIGLPPKPSAPQPLAVRRFAKAIATLSASKLDRTELRDEESRQLLRLAAQKLARGEDVVEVELDEEAGGDGEIPDLMSVLKWSLREGADRSPNQKPRAGKTSKAPRTADSLEELTKTELYQQASEREIPGRSGMNKAQLIRALRSS